jgi:hypothetical protein
MTAMDAKPYYVGLGSRRVSGGGKGQRINNVRGWYKSLMRHEGSAPTEREGKHCSLTLASWIQAPMVVVCTRMTQSTATGSHYGARPTSSSHAQHTVAPQNPSERQEGDEGKEKKKEKKRVGDSIDREGCQAALPGNDDHDRRFEGEIQQLDGSGMRHGRVKVNTLLECAATAPAVVM